eukprot:jgi/Psemu1/18895/gm1.18895_g
MLSPPFTALLKLKTMISIRSVTHGTAFRCIPALCLHHKDSPTVYRGYATHYAVALCICPLFQPRSTKLRSGRYKGSSQWNSNRGTGAESTNPMGTEIE